MISKMIEEVLRAINIDTVTDIFILVILFLLLLAIVLTKLNRNHAFTDYAPSLLTSIGILGTFTGIVIGLLSFNVNNIDGSITDLLEGLKVAFITSLVGMLSSIFYKFLSSTNIISPSQTSEIKEDVTVKDLYTIMYDQNQNIIKVQELLSNSADSSLVGQIKLMRSDINDNSKLMHQNLFASLDSISETLLLSQTTLTKLDENQNKQQEEFNQFVQELWIKLQDFADMLSKSATEQVIEALKNVIKEFNEKLTEQFGENFKELNSAVKDLVIWQDNYKVQLSEMENQFILSVKSMSDMEKSIDLISDHSKSIPDSMSSLEKIIITNQHQVDELSRHLDAFKDIRDRAVEAVPEIRTQIDTTVKGIQDASVELISGVTTSTDKITTVIVQSADDFANNVNATNSALVESSSTLMQSSTDIKDQLNLTIEDINKHVREMIEHLSTNSKEISSNFKDIGVSLETELTKTNQHMLQNFTSMIDELSTHTKSVNDNFKDSAKNIGEELQDVSSKTVNILSNTTSELQKNIENLAQEQLKQTTKVLNGLDKAVEKTIQDTTKSLSKQVETMDAITAKEIENVMNAMGRSLASIAGQFTNDYQKLVKEMKKIIETHR